MNPASSNDNASGKAISQWVEPKPSPDDLFFAMPRNRKRRSSLRGLYVHMSEEFAKTLDRTGFGNREDGNERRREITFHSFRRFVKTTISDLGYADYSEWFIGHEGSVYWKKKEREKADLFKKIEPYLTFLNVPQLERQGADLQTKIEELHDVNQLLRYKQNEKEEQIKKLEESVAFLADKFNAFLASQPGNKILYEDNSGQSGLVKGIELKPEINNKAVGKVISSSISTSTNNRSNKKK